MDIQFVLNDDEDYVTPMKVADALVNVSSFSHKDIKEIIAYLTVWSKYNDTTKPKERKI